MTNSRNTDRNIYLNYVAKGNHKANGLAEKLVKEVHAAINKLANGDLKQWHRLIPVVEFNLRTAPNSTTGITPAMALYGRELKKGVLEIPQTETSLDERHYGKRRKAAQEAMKAISTMRSPVKKPRGKLKGKTYAIVVHRDPPKT